jgi:hypothetical protein
VNTLHPYEDTRRWHDWAEDYYEEMIEDHERRRLEADNERCGYVPPEEE